VELLKPRPNPNVKCNADNETPLHMAVKDVSCYPDTVQLLLQHGAYVDTRRRDSKTPPHLPAERSRVGVASELINHDTDVNARDNSGPTPLLYAAKYRLSYI